MFSETWTGVVEFVRKEDMTYAVRKLDNTKFRSHEVCVLIWLLISVMDNVSLPCRGEYFVSEAQPGPLFFPFFPHYRHRQECCLFNVKFSCVRQGETAYIRVKLDGPPQPELRKITPPAAEAAGAEAAVAAPAAVAANSRGRGRGSPPLLASSQAALAPVPKPFYHWCFALLMCTSPDPPLPPPLLLFWPFHEFLQMSAIDFKFFPFHVPMSLWMILVCRCAPSLSAPSLLLSLSGCFLLLFSPSPSLSRLSLSLSLSLLSVLSNFCNIRNGAVLNFQKRWVIELNSMFLQELKIEFFFLLVSWICGGGLFGWEARYLTVFYPCVFL